MPIAVPRRSLQTVLALVAAAALALTGTVVAAGADELNGSVWGTVTGASAPLDGISVTLTSDSDGATYADAALDAGLYSIEGVPAGSYTLTTFDGSGSYDAATITGVIVEPEIATQQDVTVTEVPVTYSLSGTVTDADGPVVGFTITAGAEPYNGSWPVSATTDSDGFYSLTGLTSTHVSLYAGGSGTPYPNYFQSNINVTGPGATHNITLVATPVGTGIISGHVRDRVTLEPIPFANVNVNSSSIGWWAPGVLTDENGYYEIPNVPVGIFDVSSYKSSSDPAVPGWVQSNSKVTISATVQEKTRDFNLKRQPSGAGVISGTVTEGGIPVAGINLSIIAHAAGMLYFSATTDANGQYSFTNLPKGKYSVSIFEFASPGGAQTIRPLTQPANLVNLATSSSEVPFDVAVQRYATGNSQVSGVVSDSRTATPISGAMVSLTPRDPANPTRYANTDSIGEWSLADVPVGVYDVYFSAMHGDYTYSEPTFITVTAGENIELSLYLASLAPGTSTVSGKITNRDTNAPVAGATVQVSRNLGGYNPDAVVTDANGLYSVPTLPDGQYSITVTVDGYQEAYGGVDVTGGNEKKNIRLVANPPVPTGEGTITGTVVDEFGLPIADAPVYITSFVTAGAYSYFNSYATTDGDGRFEFFDLALVDTTVNVNQPNNSDVEYASATVIAELDATTTNLDLEIALATAAQISGTVTIDGGELTDSTIARAINAETGAVNWGSSIDGATGDYLLTQLPAGDYVIQFVQESLYGISPDLPGADDSLAQAYWVSGDADGTASRDDATVITVEPGDLVENRDIVLHEGGVISGFVAMAAGTGSTPLPDGRNVRVNVYALSGGSWVLHDYATAEASRYSGSQFRVTGLAPGSYKLEYIDMWDGNRAFVTTYSGGASSLSAASVLTVTAGAVTNAGTRVLAVQMPTVDPDEIDLAALDAEEVDALEGQISTDTDQVAGEEATIEVGAEFAGEWVAVWANSTPTRVSDWMLVAGDGTITATLPSSLVGSHRLIVQDADQAALGWAPVTIAAAPTSGTGGSTTPPATGGTNATPATPVVPGKTGGTKSPGSNPDTATDVEVDDPAADDTAAGVPASDAPAAEADEPDNVTTGAAPAAVADSSDGGLPILWILLAALLVAGVVIGGALLLRARRA